MFKVKPEPSNLVSYRVITLLFKLSVALVKQSLIREPGSQPLPEHRLGMNIYKAEGIFFLFLKREFEVILHVFFSRCRWWDVQTPSFPCLLKERSFLGDIFIKISACRKMTRWRISAQEIRDLKGGMGGGGAPALLGRDKLAFPKRIKLFLLSFASLLRKCLLRRQVRTGALIPACCKEGMPLMVTLRSSDWAL